MLNDHWRHLAIALQFLTRLPVSPREPAEPEEAGRSVLYYPLVGLFIGALLWLTDGLLGGIDPMVRAAFVLTAWVLVSGALHLDGLADTADAWVGGHGDEEKTLAIMKDPCTGPMGAVAVVLVLVMKFAALVALSGSAALWLAPLAGRALLVALLLTTPYVRRGGLGEAMSANLPPSDAKVVLGVTALAAVVLFGGAGFAALTVATVWFVLFRARLVARLQGTTGDTAGAMVEIGEALVLALLTLV